MGATISLIVIFGLIALGPALLVIGLYRRFISKRPHKDTVTTGIIVIVAEIMLFLTCLSGNINFTEKAYQASAKSAGRRAKLAEEAYCWDQKDGANRFTTDLNKLLAVNKNLTDDPAVTFVFVDANQTGFTLYTEHGQATGKTFLYTN